uniref:G protein-coupled receptor n=1 Tax=Panagrellus redivivus TaxID=6233 RepID=A0A7E4VR86_PANRE
MDYDEEATTLPPINSMDDILIAVGVADSPVGGGSAFLATIFLILDMLFVILRIPVLAVCFYSWIRGDTALRTSFMAFAAVWAVIDLPRFIVYSGPMLFVGRYGTTSLLDFAFYYNWWTRFAKYMTMVVLGWNRVAVLVLKNTSSWSMHVNGPTCLLLLCLPLWLTTLTRILERVFSFLPIFGYISIAIAFVEVIVTVLIAAPHCLRSRFTELALTAFPASIAFLTLICNLIQDLAVYKSFNTTSIMPSTANTNLNGNSAVLNVGMEMLYHLLIDHAPLVVLVALYPPLKNALMLRGVPTTPDKAK